MDRGCPVGKDHQGGRGREAPSPATETGSFPRGGAAGTATTGPGRGTVGLPPAVSMGRARELRVREGLGSRVSSADGATSFDGAGWEIPTSPSAGDRVISIYGLACAFNYAVHMHVHIRPRETHTKTLTVLCLYDRTMGALIFLKIAHLCFLIFFRGI